MDTLSAHSNGHLSLAGLARVSHSRHLQLIQTAGRESEAITELIAALALHSHFYIIAAGEWLPAYALTRSVRRRTHEIKQALDRVHLARPFTCYQLLDLLAEARPESEPILILDFLHHFYNEDIELSIRCRVFEQCCTYLQRLSLFRPVLVFVQRAPTAEYKQLFPVLTSIADKAFQMEETVVEHSQLALF